jgi:hypothetical protein
LSLVSWPQVDASVASYAKCVAVADPDFVNLADACFSLCVLGLMASRKLAEAQRPPAVAAALLHYKAGLKAQRNALLYLPFVGTQVSRSMAKVGHCHTPGV